MEVNGKIAASGGGAGDIIYALSLFKKMGVETVYVKRSNYPPGLGDMFTSLKRLVESQGYRCLPTSGDYPHFKYEPGLSYDYDLDIAKNLPDRGMNHIIVSYCKQFKLPFRHPEWTTPWLIAPETNGNEQPYSVFFVTNRWREWSTLRWKDVYARTPGRKIFCGFPEDHNNFCIHVNDDVEFYPTIDLYDLMLVINGSRALYCNQSSALTIAQGLGKKYYLEVKPRRTNTLMFTPIENILNPQDQ